MRPPRIAFCLLKVFSTLPFFAACSNDDSKRHGQTPPVPLEIQPRADNSYAESKPYPNTPRLETPAPARTEEVDTTSNPTRLG